jgi:hypothetical protein
MQSQEKKVGDRLSVPNIEDYINVKLDVNTIPCNSRQGDNHTLPGEESPIKRDTLDSIRTTKRSLEPLMNSNELDQVRSMLEYLYLDVKVRSPSEVSDLIQI